MHRVVHHPHRSASGPHADRDQVVPGPSYGQVITRPLECPLEWHAHAVGSRPSAATTTCYLGMSFPSLRAVNLPTGKLALAP
jgi:hypothetical protein